LLDFSASRQLAMAPEDLNAVIGATLRLVRHELARKEIRVIKHLAKDLPLTGMDKNRLQQVFVNIFMNALQAMPRRGTLTVRTCARQLTQTPFHEGSRQPAPFWVGDTAVVAEVEDTGPGIPQEHLLKIFDPFFTTKPAGAGTGLGLPVSRKIIEVHGGRLEVANKNPGPGVRVTVLLKALKKESHEKTHPAGR
jgi:signal transduction histidine kinase